MDSKKYKLTILTILLFFIFKSAIYANEPFFIADDIDAAPYISGNSETQPTGIFFDIIKKAFERMEIQLKYEIYPWKRAQMLVQNKQADALITIPTPKRLEYLVPSQEPVFVMKYKIFTQDNNLNIAQIQSVKYLDDLKGLIIIDYLGDGWAEKNLAQFKVHWAPNLSSACKMIAAARGDVFLQDEMMVLHAIKNIKNTEDYWNQRFKNIISFDAPVKHVGFHMLIHKDSKFLKLLPKFNETIRVMRKDGEIDKITNKWIN